MISLSAAIHAAPQGAGDARTTSTAPQFWFEDNNMREAGGFPPDFREMFERPETWKELRSHIDVYYIRSNSLKKIFDELGEAFVRDRFVKVLKDAGIPIAIDNTAQYQLVVPKLVEYGATVSHLALQSTISKCEPHEVPARVEQAITMMIEVGRKLPGVKIGLIDATPTKGRPYQEHYRRLLAGVRAGGGRFDFVHLDCPSDQATGGQRITWQKVKEVERFVKGELGIEFGFICVSASGGKASDEQFHRDVMSIPERCIGGGSAPDHFVMMSWFPHPARALPEDAPEGEYPMTKTALQLARALRAKDWTR